MKKLLTILTIGFLATQASAISISWQLAGVAFGGQTLKSAGEEFVASLIYLGPEGTLSSSGYSIATLADDLNIVKTSTSTTTKGVNTGSYDIPVADPSANGDVYAMLLSYTTGGKTYYNLSSVTFEVSGIADATSGLDQYKIASGSQNYSTGADSPTVKAGGGWTAVPEPSTAALALAGLALLLKRRKA